MPEAIEIRDPHRVSLNLGCGTDIRPGFVNLDCSALPGVDVVHDLNSLPLPFKAATFDHIVAKDVLEHVDYIPLLRELHRILKPGGELFIQVPHFSSANNYIDPTHKNRFSILTFEFFVAGAGLGRDYYFDFAFQALRGQRISFLGGPLLYNRPVGWFVNLNRKTQKYYEITFLVSAFPAENISVVLIR